jgi:hypothetical protein
MTAYAYIGKLKNGVSPENEIAIRTIRIMVGSRTRASVCRLHCCPLPKHLATVKKHSFGVGGNKNARRNKRKKRLNVCVRTRCGQQFREGRMGQGVGEHRTTETNAARLRMHFGYGQQRYYFWGTERCTHWLNAGSHGGFGGVSGTDFYKRPVQSLMCGVERCHWHEDSGRTALVPPGPSICARHRDTQPHAICTVGGTTPSSVYGPVL